MASTRKLKPSGNPEEVRPRHVDLQLLLKHDAANVGRAYVNQTSLELRASPAHWRIIEIGQQFKTGWQEDVSLMGEMDLGLHPHRVRLSNKMRAGARDSEELACATDNGPHTCDIMKLSSSLRADGDSMMGWTKLGPHMCEKLETSFS